MKDIASRTLDTLENLYKKRENNVEPVTESGSVGSPQSKSIIVVSEMLSHNGVEPLLEIGVFDLLAGYTIANATQSSAMSESRSFLKKKLEDAKWKLELCKKESNIFDREHCKYIIKEKILSVGGKLALIEMIQNCKKNSPNKIEYEKTRESIQRLQKKLKLLRENLLEQREMRLNKKKLKPEWWKDE